MEGESIFATIDAIQGKKGRSLGTLAAFTFLWTSRYDDVSVTNRLD